MIMLNAAVNLFQADTAEGRDRQPGPEYDWPLNGLPEWAGGSSVPILGNGGLSADRSSWRASTPGLPPALHELTRLGWDNGTDCRAG